MKTRSPSFREWSTSSLRKTGDAAVSKLIAEGAYNFLNRQFMETPTFLLHSVRNVISDCRSLSNDPIVLGGPGETPETVAESLDFATVFRTWIKQLIAVRFFLS